MPASNGVFGASGALSRVDSYFAIFAARHALKDCWEAPPAAKPQIVRRQQEEKRGVHSEHKHIK